MRDDYSDLPDFEFPVVAWAPDVATGEATDEGIRFHFGPRDVVRTSWLAGNPRLGWTFVDSTGRRWEVAAVRVSDNIKRLLMKIVSITLYEYEYRLVCDWVERPPVTFEAVRERLTLAVEANPTAYPGRQRREHLKRLETAERISDLIEPGISVEEDEISRLVAIRLPQQWLSWKGRCSRRAFAAVFAIIGVLWLAVWLHPNAPGTRSGPVMFLTFGTAFLGLSLVVRRLHDLRQTGWWAAYWGLWTIICAFIHDIDKDGAPAVVAGWLWWVVSACMVVWLSILPGTPGPNRYGFGRERPPTRTVEVGAAPRRR